MKIAILSRYQKTHKRGVESVVEELSKRLSKSHQVDIYTGMDSDNLGLILKNKYDVVMPTNGRMQSLKMSLGRFRGNYKLVIGGHSGVGRDDIFNIVVVRPDCFIALTNYMANWAKKWGLGIKITKIPNGVDLEKFNPKGEKIELDLERPVILSVGALVWYKHHEKTIEAVSRLKKGSLLIVGNGEKKEELEKLGRQKLGERFQISQYDYEQMPKIYRSADVFTLPSWDREAFGVVYLEAMASGIAVVAPNDSSRKEIVGNGGVLVNCDDYKSFSEALELALNREWGALPRGQASHFSWEKIAGDYERCFKSILS